MPNTIGSITGASLNGFYTHTHKKNQIWLFHLTTSQLHTLTCCSCLHGGPFFSFYSSLQALHGSRRTEREAEAEAHPDHVHQRPAEGAGAGFCWDALPGHLHQRRVGSQNRSDWSQSAGRQLPADSSLLQLHKVAHKLRTDALTTEPF